MIAFKTYQEAKAYALELNEHDLWVFETPENNWQVIRGFAFKHYCSLGWIPRAHLELRPVVTEMFTGVVL